MKGYLFLASLLVLSGCGQVEESRFSNAGSLKLTGYKNYNQTTNVPWELSSNYSRDHFDLPKKGDGGDKGVYYLFKVTKKGNTTIDLNIGHESGNIPTDSNGAVLVPKITLGTMNGQEVKIIKEGNPTNNRRRLSYNASLETFPEDKNGKPVIYVLVINQPKNGFLNEKTMIDINFQHAQLAIAGSDPLELDIGLNGRGSYQLNIGSLKSQTKKTQLVFFIRNDKAWRSPTDQVGLFSGDLSVNYGGRRGQNCSFKIESAKFVWVDDANKRQEADLAVQDSGCYKNMNFSLLLKKNRIFDPSKPKQNYRILATVVETDANASTLPPLNLSAYLSRTRSQNMQENKVIKMSDIRHQNRGGNGYQNGYSSKTQGFTFKFDPATGSEAIINFQISANVRYPLNMTQTNLKNKGARDFILYRIKSDGSEEEIQRGKLSAAGDSSSFVKIFKDLSSTYKIIFKLPYGIGDDAKAVTSYLNVRAQPVKLLPKINPTLVASLKDEADNKKALFFDNVDELHKHINSTLFPTGAAPRWSEHAKLDASKPYPNVDLRGPTGSSKTTGLPFKAKVIYEAMVHIRDKYHTVRDRAKVLAGASPTNYVNPRTISACLGNTAAHWSDIILHFYCQFGQMRGTYTNFIRSEARKIQQMPETNQAEKLAKAKAAAELRMKAYDFSLKQANNTGRIGEEWKWVRDFKFDVDGKTYQMKHVFEYVMTSTTFQFLMAQEQNVINAFYRVPFDSNGKITADTCRNNGQGRVRRAIDESGAGKNLCAADKNHSPRLAPAHR